MVEGRFEDKPCDVPLLPVVELSPEPESTFSPEVVARLIRITSGNLRLLTRILTQIERVLSVNDAEAVSLEIVDAARASLVIGQA